jgi:hypothetical protein
MDATWLLAGLSPRLVWLPTVGDGDLMPSSASRGWQSSWVYGVEQLARGLVFFVGDSE